MAPINVTTSKQQITAAVAEDKVTATVTGGFGATGPSGVINVTAPITNAGTTTAANVGLAVGDGLSVSSGSLRVTPGTYATLVGGKVPADQLPSYVDDVLEFASVGVLPALGETGKIYVALNTGKIYRWSGSAYFEISGPPASTDAVPEGSSNLYFTNARARNSFGTGTTGQVVTWSGGEWTAGTVAIASVTGLQTALDGKSASSHNHDASAINAGTLSADRLPLASANTRGAVRVGTGVAIDGDGVISVNTDYAASSHTHGNITSSGAIGTTSGQIVVTTTGGALTTASTISASAVSGLAAVATSGAYSSLTGLPTLGTAAASATTDFAAASHSHAASAITSGTLDIARLPVGTSSTTVAAGNDSRFSDARTPTDGSVTDAKIATAGLSASTINWVAIQPWAANTAYQKGDLVSNAGIAYRRSAAGTSGATFNVANWQQITPSEFVGSQITSGTVPIARLGTGSPSASNFLRGDGTFAAAGSTSASDLSSGTLANARLTTRARASMNLYLWSSFR